MKGGDKVEVTLEVDAAPREVEVPKDLAAMLKKAGATVELLALPNAGHNSVNKETVERALVWTDRALGVKR